MPETIVVFPAHGIAQLTSMVELGKLIFHHHSNFSITILVAAMPNDTKETILSYTNTISETNPPISFLTLPPTSPLEPNPIQPSPIFELMRLNVIDSLHTMSLNTRILAFITSIVQLSYDPNIPTYYYFTSGASALVAILYFPTIHNQTTTSFKDSPNTVLNFPGLPPIKASHLPEPLLNRETELYQYFLNFQSCVANSKGIITNTFDELEPRAIEAITKGSCYPDSSTSSPSLYCVGPLVVDSSHRAVAKNDTHDCLKWLDGQPKKSVVFLCFGSRGAFSVAQIKEIATGLERSEQRFLWVVRSLMHNSDEDPDLESLLPEGFSERTKTRGLVVKPWVPQERILRHESVGGFVTHCGWNSVAEAVSSGVPMVTWPLYAEQRLNSVVLVEEIKLAIPIETMAREALRRGKNEGIVSGEEVEKRMRELMGCGNGMMDVRQRCLDMKVMAEAAWKEGGSSLAAFSILVAPWKGKKE